MLDWTGREDGARGWAGPNGEVENIIIGSGATVTYDADSIGSDFQMLQGSTLNVVDGARWVQITDAGWAENRWTEMDLTLLNLDGGSFIRTGEVPGEGGGALIFSSWKGDDTWSSPDHPVDLDHQEIEVRITNGGRLENEGQMWIGGWDDMRPNGTVISFIIDDGHIDLTGGNVSMGEPADADLVIADKFWGEEDDFNKPSLSINFAGPGSITVDSAGIVYAQKDVDEVWQNLDPITYQELWDAGILQADGLSGPDGAAFASYFTVSGALGQDNYTLTRVVNTTPGDFDNDGALTAIDIDLLSAEVLAGTNNPTYDVNSDGSVNAEDRNEWVGSIRKTYFGDSNLDGQFDSADFVAVFTVGEYEDAVAGNSTWAEGDWNGDGDFDSGDFVLAFTEGGYEAGPHPAVSSVPEPSACVLFALGMLGFASRRRR